MRKIIAIVLFFICQNLLAQDPYFINYSTNDGLPSSNIYSIFQQENGIIWFTTDVGIVKYDSKKFELFNTDHGLSDNEVFRMNKDFRGRIWLQTLNGNPSFIYNGKIYNEHNSNLLKQCKGSGLSMDFFQDKHQNIYLTYRNSEIVIIDKNNKTKRIKRGNGSLSGVWESENNMFGITSEYIINIKTNEKTKCEANSIPYRVFQLKKNTIVGKSNILYATKGNQLKEILALEPSLEIINLVEESENRWWICTRKGLILYENNVLKNHYFKDCSVSGILKDFEGNYWISTLNKGVLFVPSFEIHQFFKDKKFNCIAKKSESEIWFGDYENNYYIKKGKSIIENSINSNLRIDKISNIRFFNQRTFVIGKTAILDISGTNSIKIAFNANDILIDNNQVYLASTYTSKFDLKTFNPLNLDYNDKRIILGKRTNVLCKGKDDKVFMGTNFGLYQFSKKDSIAFLGEKNTDLQASIEALFYDSENGLLLVGSASKGLVILKNEKTFQKINTTNGLNNNTCVAIKKLKKNEYLIGTNNGLNLVKLLGNKTEVTNINPPLRLQNKRIKAIEIANDTTYLATEYGLLFYRNDYISNKKPIPKCLINGLKSAEGFLKSNKIEYQNNDISINFTGISYIDKGEVTYFYKLNSDNQWFSTNETQINYKSLAANKYQFSVYCVNGFGIKSKVESIEFEILKPFYQKLWFIFLISILIVLVLYFYIRRQLQKQRKRFDFEKQTIQNQRDKAQLEKQMIELEQKALRLQMNPHFIFNALNTIKGYYSEGETVKASSYISKFSKLLRMLLENTDQTISLAKELEMLELYVNLTQIRYKDKFDYQIILDPNINVSDTAIPTLLLQPMVENAIIHGLAPKNEKGLLTISFHQINNQLECVVEDDGIGRKASQKNQSQNKEHQSKALEITNERLALFNENIGKSSIEIMDLEKNNQATGTKVIIKIPLISIW